MQRAEEADEIFCPFQLLYADGVEQLAAESARERVRWLVLFGELICPVVLSLLNSNVV
jgi:hypothetical protein